MADFALFVIFAAVASVAAVLVMGLISFMREGPSHRRRSNRLMQWRVGLQFLAVILVVLFVALKGAGG